jgi:hypothetical protein
MREDEKKMIGLLCEINEICKDIGAGYYVIEQELLSVYRPKRSYEAEADICMLYSDFLRVKDRLSEKEDRTLECLENNISMPGMFFRYVDEGSLLYVQKYHKVRKAHGVAVNIHILRNKGKDSMNLIRREELMETGIEGMHEDGVFKLKLMRSFPSCFRKKTEKQLDLAALTDMETESLLKIPGIAPMSFPAGFWSKKKNIEIDKNVFTTTACDRQYLTARYGEDYESRKMVNLLENYQVLSFADVPYGSVVNKIDAFLDTDPSYRDIHERYTRFYNDEYSDMVMKEAEGWDILFYVDDRMRMWKKYDPCRDKIKDLLEEGRKDEAFMIFDEYFSLFKSYLKKGKVLFFDDEIWKICSELWKEYGYEDLIDEAGTIMEENKVFPVSADELRKIKFTEGSDTKVRIRNF